MQNDFMDLVNDAVALLRKEFAAAVKVCDIFPQATDLQELVDQDAELVREFDDFHTALLNKTIAEDAIEPTFHNLRNRITTLHNMMKEVIVRLVLDQLNGNGIP